MVGFTKEIDGLCINTLRTLTVDMIQKANSGHPGLPTGAAPMAHVLWSRHLKHNPEHPDWPDRDRFVLSAGHGSSLLYALLHLYGYPLSLSDLKSFRQWDSLTPGHPEAPLTAGVEATTGPLGQGFANAVGMAIAERFLAGRFNRPGHEIVNHFTYTLAGDGCIMEGVAMEATSLAGHLGLGKLIALYDANDVTLDGPAEAVFTEDVGARFMAQGWHVITVADGDNDVEALDWALAEARKETSKPSLLVVKTTIGFGSDKAGTSAAHGSPFGVEGVKLLKRTLGFDPEAHFVVPDAVAKACQESSVPGQEEYSAWQKMTVSYRAEHPDLAAQWDLCLAGELPAGWDVELASFAAGEKQATRGVGGKVLNALAARIPWFLGGDADLSCSTKSAITAEGAFHSDTPAGRNLRYGVREHAMAAIANGLAYHGGVRNYISTFFVFADYMRPSIRLAAMNHLPVIYVFTHDSVAVGEDGPTHQPVEHLMSLRVIPNLVVIRPADAGETLEAWKTALKLNDRPVALVLTRQGVVTLDPEEVAAPTGLGCGAYVLRDSWDGKPDAIVIASGSEVSLALEAQVRLQDHGIHVRVVSMPSWELFDEQPEAYRKEVLPPEVKCRIAIEAGVSRGWEYYVGDQGVVLGIDRFGASAPGSEVMARLGMNTSRIEEAVFKLLDRR
jgi:transketolase